MPNGDFVYTCLTNNSEGGAILEASGHWNEKNMLEVMDLNKQEVLDWTLTGSNKFYYKIMETYAPTIEHYTCLLYTSCVSNVTAHIGIKCVVPFGDTAASVSRAVYYLAFRCSAGEWSVVCNLGNTGGHILGVSWRISFPQGFCQTSG